MYVNILSSSILATSIHERKSMSKLLGFIYYWSSMVFIVHILWFIWFIRHDLYGSILMVSWFSWHILYVIYGLSLMAYMLYSQ